MSCIAHEWQLLGGIRCGGLARLSEPAAVLSLMLVIRGLSTPIRTYTHTHTRLLALAVFDCSASGLRVVYTRALPLFWGVIAVRGVLAGTSMSGSIS